MKRILSAARRLALPVLGAGLLAAPPAEAEQAMAKVQQAEQDGGVWEVGFDAGRLDGVQPESEVVLLRAGEPIVHPLSGQVLGVPQEPVGRARVFAMEDRSARAVLLKVYSAPQSGDMVEYAKGPIRPPMKTRSVPKAAAAPQVDQVLKRVQALERRVQQAQPPSAQLPDRRVLDELEVMKSYLLALDERLVRVEHRQGEQGHRMDALKGIAPAEQMEELTIRYSKDTQLKLRVDGKILTVDVVADTLRLRPPVAAAEAAPTDEASWWDGLFGGGESAAAADETPSEAEGEALLPAEDLIDDMAPEADDESWYESPWIAAVTAALALAGGSYYLMRRRREYEELLTDVDAGDGLFDDDSDEGDEYDDDDEEDEEDEEYEDERRFSR